MSVSYIRHNLGRAKAVWEVIFLANPGYVDSVIDYDGGMTSLSIYDLYQEYDGGNAFTNDFLYEIDF